MTQGRSWLGVLAGWWRKGRLQPAAAPASLPEAGGANARLRSLMQSPTASPVSLAERVAEYLDPVLGRSLGEAGVELSVDESTPIPTVRVRLAFPADGYRKTFVESLAAHIGVPAKIELSWAVSPYPGTGTARHPEIKNVLAVASGKGGVGKSTVAVNLALALAGEGASVGLLDADVYGPSQPLMLGVQGPPESPDGKVLEPIRAHGLQTMSIGYLVDPAQPVIWRGPMVTQALSQMLGDTRWQALDYLVLDLPPGTGDLQLSMAQRISVAGAIIVTTPQDVALLDARKGLRMFEKVSVPVLGVVENMSFHVCSNCGHHDAIFGEGGGGRLATEAGVELLAQLPLVRRVREQTDSGRPPVVAEPDGETAGLYRALARRVAARLAYGRQTGNDFPEIVVSED